MTLELAPVLDELGEQHRRSGTESQVATMTLVVFFEDAAIGKLARERIGMLAGKHPSRVIVLDAGQGEDLHRVVSRDWIELGVKNSGADVLRSAIAALSAPEAPIVLLWVAPEIGSDERFARLSQHAQIVVYNSSLMDNGRAALCEVVDYLHHHRNLAFADVAYLRLGPWQESIATFFDGKDVGELFELQGVEVACGSDPEAYYLLGWLASRLNWRSCGGDAFLDRRGRRITFEIERKGEPRRISTVRLQSARVRFLAEADPKSETIHLSVCGGEREQHRYRAVVNPGIAALLERAILWGQNDRIFRDSLVAAGEILACRKE